MFRFDSWKVLGCQFYLEIVWYLLEWFQQWSSLCQREDMICDQSGDISVLVAIYIPDIDRFFKNVGINRCSCKQLKRIISNHWHVWNVSWSSWFVCEQSCAVRYYSIQVYSYDLLLAEYATLQYTLLSQHHTVNMVWRQKCECTDNMKK